MTPRRVAFFTHRFHEVNGVVLTSREFVAFGAGVLFRCSRCSRTPAIANFKKVRLPSSSSSEDGALEPGA
jgi:hypothetical protein